MAVFEPGLAPSADSPRTSNLMNYAGAALSLALIVGVSVWGYQLIMRDVSGIPVVRAMEGDMRVLPDNPGGDVALHTGLAVNEVAAMGEAGGPEDRLVLAPRTAGLAQEDIARQPQTTEDTAPAAPVDTASLTDQLLAEIVATNPDAIAASVPGVATSMRPAVRPAGLRIVAQAAPAAVASEVSVSTTTFAEGTHLVQLGAYPTPALAAAQWDRLQAQFGQLMVGRERVIQVSNQSSGTWYRLRASGFLDRAEARRLCAAMQAENTDCIAVVVN